MTEFYYFALSFLVYGFLGWCTEVAYAAVKQGKFVNRGFLNGPICPVYGIGVGVVVQFLTPVENNLVLLYISSTILVTAIEGITGFLLEKIFHNKWWDYSDQPLNIGGYVCVLFSLIWGVFCVLIVKVIHPLIYKVLTMIPFVLGIIVMACLAVGLLADLYVTASAILKMNRKLETMEKIAAELKDLSNKVGENIYENVMEGMEFQEEKKEQLGNVREELKERLEEPKAIMNWSQRRSKGTPGRTKSPYGENGSEDQCRRDEGPYGRVKSKIRRDGREPYKGWRTSCESVPEDAGKAA